LKNNGKMQALNLVASKVKIAEKRMKSRLIDGVFSDGTDSEVFNGLQEIIKDDADYGGIAVGDILLEDGGNGWAAIEKDNAGTDRALSLSLIQSAMGAATEDSDMPTVAVSKQSTFDELWNLLSPHQRLVKDTNMSGLGHKGVLNYNGRCAA
jgi:hypothetical protein